MKKLDAFLRAHLAGEFECVQKNKILFITLKELKGDLVIVVCQLRKAFEDAGLTDYELVLMHGVRLVYTDFNYRLHPKLNETFDGAWIAFIWYTDSAYIPAVEAYIKNS